MKRRVVITGMGAVTPIRKYGTGVLGRNPKRKRRDRKRSANLIRKRIK